MTGIAATMFVLILTASLQAQPTPGSQAEIAELKEKAQAAYAEEKWVHFYSANMKLHKLLPFEPQYLVNVVKACAMLDRKSTAYHYMLLMQQQGFTYDFNADEETAGIRGTEVYQHINKLLIDAGKPAGEGTVAFRLKGHAENYRAIAWDESRQVFLAGTVAEGALLSVTERGETELLLEANEENGLWSITGMAVDAANNRLWLASSATPQFTAYSIADKNRGALFELDLQSLEILRRYNLPVDGLNHELGSLALTADGHVYVIDQATPIVYARLPESQRLEAFFASPETRSLDSIAVTPDNSRIFLSDAVQGVLVIDPVAQQARMLSGPETMNLGGIESVSYRDGHLYIIQGRFMPPRIIRLELDSSGAGAASVAPMAMALNEFNRPGVGTIRDGRLYYIANAGAGDESGAVVMSTPLDAGAEAAPPQVTGDGAEPPPEYTQAQE
jgi:hypothetical protein